MPTYEYQCLKCKKKFDKFQSMKEEPLKKCIHCKGKVERLISAGAGVIFKGSGFYGTDYKKQRTEDRGQKTEDRKQRTENKEQKNDACGPCKQESCPQKKKE